MLEPVKFLFILTGASTYLVTKYIKVGLDDTENTNQTSTTAANNTNHSAYLNSQNQSFWSNPYQFGSDDGDELNSKHSNWTTSPSPSFHYEDVRLGHRIHHRHRFNSNRNGSFNPHRSLSTDQRRIADGTLRRIFDRYNEPLDRNDQHSNQQNTNNRINQQQNPSNPYHIALIPSPSSSSFDTVERNDSKTSFNSNKKHQNWVNTAKNNNLKPASSTRTPTFEIEINEEDDRSLPKRLLQITLTNDDNTNLVSDQQRFVHYFIEEDLDDEDYFLQETNKELPTKPDSSGTSRSGSSSHANNQNEPKFSINNRTGEIFVLKALDRDRPNGRPWYKLNAYAQNIHTKQILGFADIWIHLRNINDNVPFFAEKVYYGNVTENGTIGLKVIQLKAIDYDDDDEDEPEENQTTYRKGRTKSNLIYSIEQNQIDEHEAQQPIFAIDPHTGWITTMVCCLDRERHSNYSIVVSAQDPSGFKTNTTVIVTLLDKNDCPPRFLQKEFHLEIDENDTADSLLLLLDSSPSSSSNSSLNSFNSTSSSMNVHHHQSSKFKPNVLLKLMVEDDDLASSNHFLFKILNQRFSPQPLYNRFKHFNINEEVDKISLLLNQDDNLSGNNSHFIIEQQMTNISNNEQYSTQNFNSVLNQNGIRGGTSALLILTKPLDYEIPNHRFIMLTVAVTDLGDWLQSTSEPSENNTGHQLTNEELQHYQEEHIDICYIYIKIRDTNDNRPRFVQHFINVSLSENIPVGSVITKFEALDLDQNGHSFVQYSLDSITNQRRYFSIDPDNGFVRLNRALDRETTPLYIVKVLASDMDDPVALSSTATLVINVEDVNDNAPFLINSTMPLVWENSPPNIKIGEINAFDKDDYTKGNGPPFTFAIDPSSDEDIRRRFRLEVDHKGEGKAILYARTTFDRESQKRYEVPVVVSDAGYPSLSATCMVTVTIGDINDNDMKDAWKNVLLYSIESPQQRQTTSDQQKTSNIKSLYGRIELGQINVEDPDDWDLDDKQFSWFDEDSIINKKINSSNSSSNFYLDSSRGLVYAKRPLIGFHQLKFQVFDRRYQHSVQSKMNIQIKSIPMQAIINSGSLRIIGLDPFDFIAIWDWRRRRKITSFKERLENNLKSIIIGCDSLEIISIMQHNHHHDRSIDVRYYCKSNDGRFLTGLYLNSMVKLKANLLNQETTLNITQIGINECMYEENHLCEQYSSSPTSSLGHGLGHGCFTEVTIDWTNPYRLIDANYTSFIGVNLITKAKCQCYYDELLSYINSKSTCDTDQILCSMASTMTLVNSTSKCHLDERFDMFTRSHMTSISMLNFKCFINNHNFDHQHFIHHQLPSKMNDLQPTQILQNVRSFKSDGVIWLDPLPICQSSPSSSSSSATSSNTNTQGNILSMQISTTESNGIIFYFGPIINTSIDSSNTQIETDFMLLELVNGSPRLLFDFGSGMQEITINVGGGIDGLVVGQQEEHKFSLNDGNWHQMDIYFDQSVVRLMLDGCVPAGTIANRTTTTKSDARHHYHHGSMYNDDYESFRKKCQNDSIITKFQHVLNVNGPFQLGGIYGMNVGTKRQWLQMSTTLTIPSFIMDNILSKRRPERTRTEQIYGFTGCIRNLIYNNHQYDLINVHYSVNSQIGCHSSQSLCAFLNKRCLNNGYCDGSYNDVRCHCPKGFYGAQCQQISIAALFRKKSFIHLSMIMPNNSSTFKSNWFDETNFYRNVDSKAGFITKIEFYFRTRQWQGQMIKLFGKNNRTYSIVEIRNGYLTFRYQLNPTGLKSSEQRLSIETFTINDGRWHHVQAFRYGQSARILLDKGGIGKSAQIIQQATTRKYSRRKSLTSDHQREHEIFHTMTFDMDADQILLGGEVNYLGLALPTTIMDDFADGCISDLKINDIDISLGDIIRSSSMVHNHNGQDKSATNGTIVKISISKQQNVEQGCQPPVDSCRNLHCRRPFRCVDEWMVAKCRCPNGYTESNNGKSCTRNTNREFCNMNPCVCAGNNQQNIIERQPYGHERIIQNDTDSKLSRLFHTGHIKSSADDADCVDGSNEDVLHLQEEGHLEEHYLIEDQQQQSEHIDGSNHMIISNNNNKINNKKILSDKTTTTFANAQIFQLEYYGLYFIILIVLIPLNIPFIIYIGYICCRNRRQRRQPPAMNTSTANSAPESSNFWNPVKSCPSSTNNSSTKSNNGNPIVEDIRENIICYRDEGGGECDIGAYDMVPLRIQIHHHQQQSTTGNHQQNPLMNSRTRTIHSSAARTSSDAVPTTAAVLFGNNNHNFDDQPTNEINSGGDVWQELTVI